VTKKLYTGSSGRLAENFVLLDKMRTFWRIIYTP